jgi:hypothetical protein
VHGTLLRDDLIAQYHRESRSSERVRQFPIERIAAQAALLDLSRDFRQSDTQQAGGRSLPRSCAISGRGLADRA